MWEGLVDGGVLGAVRVLTGLRHGARRTLMITFKLTARRSVFSPLFRVMFALFIESSSSFTLMKS